MAIVQGEYIVIQDPPTAAAFPEPEPGNPPIEELVVMDLFYPATNAAKVVRFGDIRRLFQQTFEELQGGSKSLQNALIGPNPKVVSDLVKEKE